MSACDVPCSPGLTDPEMWRMVTDPEMWRLAGFKAAHPEVQVGCEWWARIPLPCGARDVVCGSLPELLDELETMSPAAGGQAGQDLARRAMMHAELPTSLRAPAAPPHRSGGAGSRPGGHHTAGAVPGGRPPAGRNGGDARVQALARAPRYARCGRLPGAGARRLRTTRIDVDEVVTDIGVLP